MTDRPPFQRFDILSRSESGLNYVREKRGGVHRVLTESELADFADPAPCAECGEQFGCEHFNCAGEPLLPESELEANVPKQWIEFARDYGLSLADLDRLTKIELHDGEYRLAPGANASDMRTNELVLLLNDSL